MLSTIISHGVVFSHNLALCGTWCMLWCQASNRQVVETSFSSCILRSKLLTQHQCCQLMMFMVDHAKLLFVVPSDVSRDVHACLHSPLSTGD